MHGAKGEEGYWLKHVAVAEFDDGAQGGTCSTWRKDALQTRSRENMPQPPTPKCK